MNVYPIRVKMEEHVKMKSTITLVLVLQDTQDKTVK